DKGDTGDQGPAGAQGATGPIGPSAVSIGSITFSSSLSGVALTSLPSDTFGTLAANSSYQVDLLVTGSAASNHIMTLPLHLEILTEGSTREIRNVQWANTSVQVLRNGSSVTIEHTLRASFTVNGSGTSTSSSLKLALKASEDVDAQQAITFSGNFRIQTVGSVLGS
ncbi:MAG: hypothetical protein ACO375_02420, partial [Candidatus Nanopelagicaceae bacterium]